MAKPLNKIGMLVHSATTIAAAATATVNVINSIVTADGGIPNVVFQVMVYDGTNYGIVTTINYVAGS